MEVSLMIYFHLEEYKMEKNFLVNTIKEVFVIVAKALKRAEMLNFWLFALSMTFCSINLYFVAKSSMASSSKLIAVWILVTLIFAAFLFALMLLWANKVSLWKDKSLMENDKKTSQKKDRSLIFYKDIASYSTHTEYLRDFLGGADEQPDPIADKLMRDFAKEIIVTSRITKRKMFVYRLHVTLFSLGVIAYMLNCLLVN